MSETETPRIRTDVHRPPAVRSWEIRRTGRSTSLWVLRTDAGKLEIRYGNEAVEVPDDFVEAFGNTIAEAAAWRDEPEEMETVHHA